ncbi:phage tail protein [Virgibacillus sp. C22-A2]|uniref:Phage tail protein n=1 Tax=Virgibacillus tibetensis TaxID=3042313 RepID=A0ABU6KCE5_9BACI|nr:phage tail protein [Virgibacillus sp. C22-A2]
MHVRNLNGDEYPLQATTTHNLELNGNQSLSFKVLPTKVNKQFINDITKMWEVVDDVTYKIIYAKRKGEGNSLTVDIKAIPLFFDDFDTDRIYEEYNQHMTANACFTLIFQDSGYNFVLSDSFDAIQWEGFGAGDTRLTLFKKALNRYKAEFRISGNTIYLESQIGRDTQFMYRHKLNASNIIQEIDAGALWTYAKGYGDYAEGDEQNANLIREYTSPIAQIIGMRHAPPIKNGTITTIETMDEQLKTLVDDSLKISVSADSHDLRKQGYKLAQPQLGDRTFLIDERIGLKDEVRVVNLIVTKDWKGNILNLNLVFGSEGIVKRHQSNMKTAISNITSLLEGRIKLPFSVLDNAVAEATKALQAAQSELIFSDNGILAIDKNDPNLVTIHNSAGFGVSDDGGATFKQAMTGNGINASVIVTGTMLADRIAGGILQSLNDNTEFDLNTGDLNMQSANFNLGGGAQINFNDNNNKMTYRLFDSESSFSRAAGVGFGTALGGRYPFTYLGTNGASELDTLSEYYSGFIANTTARIAEGGSNSISGYRFQLRNKAVGWDKGVTFDFFGSSPSMNFIGSGTNEYSIGTLKRLYTRQEFQVLNYVNGTSGWMVETNYAGSGADIRLRGYSTQDYNYQIGDTVHRIRNIYLTNSPDVSSDRRLKEDIEPSELGLGFINILNPMKYRMKLTNADTLKGTIDKNPYQYGIIAQDLQLALEESGLNLGDHDFVSESEDGMLGVKETELIFPIINAVQELSQRLEVLENGTA